MRRLGVREIVHFDCAAEQPGRRVARAVEQVVPEFCASATPSIWARIASRSILVRGSSRSASPVIETADVLANKLPCAMPSKELAIRPDAIVKS